MRRFLHASTALVLLVVPVASWTALRNWLVAAAFLAVAVEIVRLQNPRVRAQLSRLIPVFRASEERRPSGAMWLVVGYAAASWFPAPAPAAGILVGALADPAASLGGTLVGSADRKTWVGTAVHFVVSVVVLAILPGPWHVALMAALVGALTERWSGRLDDNVTVPPAVSLVVAVLA